MPRPDKSQTAMAVLGILVIGAHFATVCLARVLANLRASLREHFLVPSERADAAIELLDDHRAFVIFAGGSVILMAMIPLLVRIWKSKPWIGILVAVVLYIPGFLYGREILHLSGKLIDYDRLLREGEAVVPTDDSGTRSFCFPPPLDFPSSVSIFDAKNYP